MPVPSSHQGRPSLALPAFRPGLRSSLALSALLSLSRRADGWRQRTRRRKEAWRESSSGAQDGTEAGRGRVWREGREGRTGAGANGRRWRGGGRGQIEARKRRAGRERWRRTRARRARAVEGGGAMSSRVSRNLPSSTHPTTKYIERDQTTPLTSDSISSGANSSWLQCSMRDRSEVRCRPAGAPCATNVRHQTVITL